MDLVEVLNFLFQLGSLELGEVSNACIHGFRFIYLFYFRTILSTRLHPPNNKCLKICVIMGLYTSESEDHVDIIQRDLQQLWHLAMLLLLLRPWKEEARLKMMMRVIKALSFWKPIIESMHTQVWDPKRATTRRRRRRLMSLSARISFTNRCT